MRKLLWPILILVSAQAYSEVTINQTSDIDCKLPEDQTLTIGCTNYCGRFNRWGLKWYARKLGYKLKIVNLRSKNQTLDYTDVDGVLIPGGSDIDPKWYMSSVTPEFREYLEGIKHLSNYSNIGKKRDEFEFDLVSNYFSNPQQRYQPILGICRGMQVLTVSQGIPLYVDIKHELGIKNRKYTLDKINITKSKNVNFGFVL